MADAAKYKQVTVLFADVERSMDIAATLDIERLREIMTELVQRSRGGGDPLLARSAALLRALEVGTCRLALSLDIWLSTRA